MRWPSPGEAPSATRCRPRRRSRRSRRRLSLRLSLRPRPVRLRPPPRGGAHAGRGRSRDAERARTPRQPLLSAARKSREQAALTLTGWGFVRGSGVGGRPRGAGGVREWGAPVAWVWRRGDPVSQLQRWLPSLLWEIRSKYRFPRLRWWLGRLVV